MLFCHAFKDIKDIPIRIQYGYGGDNADAAVTATLNTLRKDLLDPHFNLKRFWQEAQLPSGTPKVRKKLMLHLKVTTGSAPVEKRAPVFARPVNDDDPPGAGVGGWVIIGPSAHSPPTLLGGWSSAFISQFNPAPNECHWSADWKEDDPATEIHHLSGQFHVPPAAPGTVTVVSDEQLKVEIAQLNYRTALDARVIVKGEPDPPVPPGPHARGAWDIVALYLAGDSVTYGARTYYCLQDNDHKRPDQNPELWELQKFQNMRGEVINGIFSNMSNGLFIWSPEAPYIMPYVTRFFPGPGSPRPDWRQTGVDADTGPKDLWNNYVTPPGLSFLTRHGNSWDNGLTLTYGPASFVPLGSGPWGWSVGYESRTRVGAGPIGGGFTMGLVWV